MHLRNDYLWIIWCWRGAQTGVCNTIKDISFQHYFFKTNFIILCLSEACYLPLVVLAAPVLWAHCCPVCWRVRRCTGSWAPGTAWWAEWGTGYAAQISLSLQSCCLQRQKSIYRSIPCCMGLFSGLCAMRLLVTEARTYDTATGCCLIFQFQKLMYLSHKKELHYVANIGLQSD